MKRHLPTVAIAVTFALLANAALAMPCCFDQGHVPDRTCCPVVKQESPEIADACCAVESAPVEVPQVATVGGETADCCCFNVPPVSAPTREIQAGPVQKEQHLAADVVPTFQLAPQTRPICDLTFSAGHRLLSGPQLLALHCTWLK